MDFNDPAQRRAFFDVHDGLPREGPGDHDSTARAIALARHVSPCKRILDVACGPGMQTMDLARLLPDADITAVDLHGPFLQEVRRRTTRDGVQDRIHIVRADMQALPFADHAFDLIWCEGAAYIMGVGRALRDWKPVLRPHGVLAITEAVWLKPDPPEPVRRMWDEYPAMTDIGGCRRLIENAHYNLLGDFALPERAWVTDYYAPMEKRIAALTAKYANDPVGAAILQEHREEIRLYQEYAAYYGYAFFVMTPAQRP